MRWPLPAIPVRNTEFFPCEARLEYGPCPRYLQADYHKSQALSGKRIAVKAGLGAGRNQVRLLNQGIESIQIYRLNQMMVEPDFLALAQVVFHAEAGQSDPEN